jgi:hypothetical protein
MREGRHQRVDREPTVDPLKLDRNVVIHPNLCLKCGSNSYAACRLHNCRLCGSSLKLPPGWELSGTDPYGYTRG